MSELAADVRDLRIVLTGRGIDVVDEISLRIAPGEVLALVGESGSGKTTVGMALLGHVRRGGAIDGGSVVICGRDVTRLGAQEVRALRGGTVAYVPQDPGTALNPALRIGAQLRAVLAAHSDADEARREARVREVLAEVALPNDDEFLRRYPHQLSGGQQQRVTIAMAFSCRPSVVVCDEPTTGLDVTTQERVLQTIRELCQAHRVAALYVSHDLAVVSELADRIAVMYGGRIVESGPRERVFGDPRHPYTRRLLRAVPDLDGKRMPVGIPGHAPLPGHRPSGCFFRTRCTLATDVCAGEFPGETDLGGGQLVRCYHVERTDRPIAVEAPPPVLPTDREPLLVIEGLQAHYGRAHVLHDVGLAVGRNECVSIVGESGSGKTTLARCVAGLHREWSGEIRYADAPLEHGARARSHESRRRIQYVFQNPYASLNPRRTIGQTIARQINLFYPLSRGEVDRRVSEALERVSLSAQALDRFPDQLSGGERQRVAIARALAVEPELLVCDEVTSALDVSVQAAIMDLLAELRATMGLSLLFITHNLAVVRSVSDRVVVMRDGRVVAHGTASSIFEQPPEGYTRRLLESTPRLDGGFAAQQVGQ